MARGIRTGNPRGFNKGRSSKFRVDSRVRQIPEEGWRTYRPKRFGNNNKDEDNNPKTYNDKNNYIIQHAMGYIRFYSSENERDNRLLRCRSQTQLPLRRRKSSYLGCDRDYEKAVT